MDYLFDDTTGDPTSTDYCDLYDRRFLHIRTTLIRKDSAEVQVYDFNDVKYQPNASQPEDHHERSRAALMLRTSGSSLGTVKYDTWASAMQVENYLKKPLLSRSGNRTFTMSDGQEYKWTSDASLGHAWTCVNSQRYLVAHYDLREEADPHYPNSSGNTLCINRTFFHLTVEIVTSLTIMRCLARRS